MKEQSIFNPDHQNSDVSSKIVAGLSRISEVFKVLLWEKAKLLGLSPIQIQLLIFIAYHKPELSNVSHLAKEFNLTKPTISDAIKVLHKKGMVVRKKSTTDNRSYIIELTETGKNIIQETDDFANPIKKGIQDIDEAKLEHLFATLSKVIYQLNRTGILTVQRTCYGCKFYSKKKDHHYCNLLESTLHNTDIRIDCPEFEPRSN
ncbi:MAG: MarR family winged helix-turn-helix transcriptional regulator [Arenibacter latericius]|nr:MarR family winged helix-turn-helix transcriptional regulator [Arenibacter latericius]